MTIWRMRVACCIPKATDTHSECVTPIAFPRQKLLPVSDSVLRYPYIGRFVMFCRWSGFKWFKGFKLVKRRAVFSERSTFHFNCDTF